MKLVSAERAEFNGAISDESLQDLINDRRVKYLQTSRSHDGDVWLRLNESLFSQRPDIELRIYGHYGEVCDLSFARRMTSVRRFSADCLMEATNVEAIAEIPQLESLHLGIFEIKSFDVLELVSASLAELTIGGTRSKKPDLRSLPRFQELRVLYVEGHSKGIESIGALNELEDLTLRSIAIEDLRFLEPLAKLWSLDLKLGGIRSFEGIEGKESIKYLELWQICELKNIDVISTLTGLQCFFLQSLPHIEEVPSMVGLQALRRVVVDNLKGMQDFSALESASGLKDFALLSGQKQMPEQLVPVLRNDRLERACGFFGSDKKNNEFLRLCETYGKASWKPTEPFSFV